MTWRCELVRVGDEVALILPDEVMVDLGCSIGDEIAWEPSANGITLLRCGRDGGEGDPNLGSPLPTSR